jgi:hypothetical protein
MAQSSDGQTCDGSNRAPTLFENLLADLTTEDEEHITDHGRSMGRNDRRYLWGRITFLGVI